jgi:hypothetical protein
MATGYVTKFGYRRIWRPGTRRLVMEHVLVWERHHGPVPPGLELHHVNGDKLDNRVENLRPVTRLEHKRIHSGCELRDGVWWKRCRKCGEFKPVMGFYQYPGRNGVMGVCKVCCVRLAVENKRKRKGREAEHRAQTGGVRQPSRSTFRAIPRPCTVAGDTPELAAPGRAVEAN